MLHLASRVNLPALRPRWLIGLLALFFLAILVQYILKLRHSEHGMRSAFLRWQPQLAELDDGVNVWEKFAYPNPPIMAILLKPFLQLPPHARLDAVVCVQGAVGPGGHPRRLGAAR